MLEYVQIAIKLDGVASHRNWLLPALCGSMARTHMVVMLLGSRESERALEEKTVKVINVVNMKDTQNRKRIFQTVTCGDASSSSPSFGWSSFPFRIKSPLFVTREG